MKNRNHNMGSSSAGVVPLHGLINANFALAKTSESKCSFGASANAYNQSTLAGQGLSPDIVLQKQIKAVATKMPSAATYPAKQLRTVKSQIRKE